MPQVPLGIEAYERAKASQPEVILRNLYLEEDKSGSSLDNTLRLQRAGLTELVDFGGNIRGIFQMDGVQQNLTFVVAGDKLYSTDWSSKTEIGTVADDGLDVSMAANLLRLGIVSAGSFYLYDDAEGLRRVELPDDQAPIDLDVLNGYFGLPTESGVWYWLSPAYTDFSSDDAILSYADAESVPDGLKAIRRLRDEFFLFGVSTIEVWQLTGNADSEFERAIGRTIDRGVQSQASVKLFDNSVVFVGDDGLVYRLTDVPQRISTHGIEERIRKRSDECRAFTFTVEGHKFYCLEIPSQGTFAYDAATQQWSEFATIGEDTWEVIVTRDTPYGPIAGNRDGKLLKIDPDANDDNGKAFERTVSGTVAVPPARIANPHIVIWIGASEDTTITLRWRDGRQPWSKPRTLTAREGADVVNAWRLGATKGAFRTFEISTTDKTNVRFSGAMANEGHASG